MVCIQGNRDSLPFLLADTRVNSNGWEVAFPQQLVKLRSSNSTLDKDDDLVELEVIKKLIELAVLLAFLQFDVVLLETVERQLGILIDKVLRGVLHELPANGLDLI
jgi:hypothetical protein